MPGDANAFDASSDSFVDVPGAIVSTRRSPLGEVLYFDVPVFLRIDTSGSRGLLRFRGRLVGLFLEFSILSWGDDGDDELEDFSLDMLLSELLLRL